MVENRIDLRTNSKLSLLDLAKELERQKETKKDYVVNQIDLWTSPKDENRDLWLNVPNVGEMPMTSLMHGQLCEKLKIPKQFYDRVKSQGLSKELSDLTNGLMHNDASRRMVRTLDGKARAFLSPSYKIVDNYDFLFSCAEEIKDAGAQVEQCYLTDKKMYIKAIAPHSEQEIRDNDRIVPGFIAENSEVGCGRYNVRFYCLRKVCMNGQIGESLLSGVHIGRKIDYDGIIRQDTIEAQNKALFLELRDCVKSAFDPSFVQRQINKMKLATEIEVEEPTVAIDNIVAKYEIPKTSRDNLLNYFTKEGDLTQFGLVQSVTNYARDLGDLDKRVEFESIGGELMDMTENKFTRLVSKPIRA